MEIFLIAVLVVVLASIAVMMGLGVAFKIHITHEHIMPQPPTLQQVVENDIDRERREKENVQKDIVSAINNYLYDREVDK